MATQSIAYGTPRVFKASGGDVVFTPTGVADSAGRISAQLDLGASGRASLYKWIVRTKSAATMTAGKVIEVRLVTSDGTRVDGNFGASDAAVSDGGSRVNAAMVGQAIGDRATSGGDVVVASGMVTIVDRYVQVLWWNALGVALSGTATDHEFVLIPIVAMVA